MIRRPPISTRTDTLFPYTTLFRSIYADGWLANTRPRRMPWEDLAPAGSADTDYEWELFNLRADFSQAKDLAPSNPAKLAEMKALFDREAERNHVFRSEERRVGKEWVSTCRSRWSRYH